MMPHHWRLLAHERNSIFKCKQQKCTLHDPWGPIFLLIFSGKTLIVCKKVMLITQKHFSCLPSVPFGVFSRGDLSPRQAKIRQTGAKTRKVATRKPAKWWLFLVFAWRPFAPPHESTRHSMHCVFGYCLSYLCLAGRKVATRKHAKWWLNVQMLYLFL